MTDTSKEATPQCQHDWRVKKTWIVGEYRCGFTMQNIGYLVKCELPKDGNPLAVLAT